MQVKMPDEDGGPKSPKHDKSCTSSVYISQPSMSIVNHDRAIVGGGSNMPKSEYENVDKPKPAPLTIQVNQINPATNQSTNNLVNIVSCFRAYPTITHGGIENVVQSNNAPFSVSVNRNNFNYGENSKSDESVNNENNQNIVNVEASSKNHVHNVNVQSRAAMKREDLDEISVDQILISENNVTQPDISSNVDYQNMELDSKTNRDQVGLIGAEIEKIVITTSTGTNANANRSLNPQQTSESVINQITNAGEVESTDNRVSSDNCAKAESQTFREQRRRDRRERRQARQRAQHGHHHVTTPVHHRLSGTVNGVEPSRTSYNDTLPDIINNHLPPPYTTLQMPTPSIHSPLTISPVPIVVDDCRFSFPIPIIRRSPSEHSGRKGCCGQFFQSPKSLGLIAMIALGGVACALGGAAWGASGLVGQPSTHLTVSLLMIGIGVVLVTISGVAWKVTTADSAHCLGMEGTEFEHCGRQQCLRNNSMSHGLLYPEFSHRSPPPTYQASMQEYRLRLLLLDRDRQTHGRRIAAAVAQQTSPPPTYRSNIGSQIRSTFLTNSAIREGAVNVFSELHGMMNSNLSTSVSHSSHSCNNRLNGVPSTQRNYHNIGINPSTQLPSVSSVRASIHSLTSTPNIASAQRSQPCQPKSSLLINQKNSDSNFIKRDTSEIILHPSKEIAEIALDNSTHVSSRLNGDNNAQFEEAVRQNNHENGLITIVTINNLSHQRGNSIA